MYFNRKRNHQLVIQIIISCEIETTNPKKQKIKTFKRNSMAAFYGQTYEIIEKS